MGTAIPIMWANSGVLLCVLLGLFAFQAQAGSVEDRLTRLEAIVSRLPSHEDLQRLACPAPQEQPGMEEIRQMLTKLQQQVATGFSSVQAGGSTQPQEAAPPQQDPNQPSQSMEANLGKLSTGEELGVSQLEQVLVDILKHSYADAEATSAAIEKASGWTQLVALTAKHSDQEGVLGPAMSIFEVATTSDGPRKLLEEAGGFKLVHRTLLAIQAETAAARMVRPLCSSLANFMVSEQSRAATDVAAASIALGSIVAGLLPQLATNPELPLAALTDAVRAIRNLGYSNSKHTSTMMQADMHRTMATVFAAPVLASTTPDHGLAVQALGAVLNLALDKDENVSQLAEAGLVGAVLQLLGSQTNSDAPGAVNTVHSCLDTVLVLSTQQSGRSALTGAKPWGTLRGVLDSKHISDTSAARSAFAVIGNLATNREAAASLLAESAESVATLLSAAQQHKASAEVQEAACGALRNIASSGGAASLVQLGAVELMVELIAIHENEPLVLQHAISALMPLAQGKHANQVKGKARKLGAIPLIKAALQMHEDVEALQGVGLHFLRELGVKF